MLWALPEWETLGSLHQAAPGDPALRGWMAYRAGAAQEVEEMVLLPGRMNPLGLRE